MDKPVTSGVPFLTALVAFFAMAKGGYRLTAGRPPDDPPADPGPKKPGRPKGSKDSTPRRKKAPPPDVVAERAFLEACGDFVRSGRPYQILRKMADDGDPRVAGWAVDKLLSYGVGLATTRPTSHPTEVGAAIAVAAAKARAELPDDEDPQRVIEAVRVPALVDSAPAPDPGAPDSQPPVQPKAPAVPDGSSLTKEERRWRRSHGRPIVWASVEARVADAVEQYRDEHQGQEPPPGYAAKLTRIWSQPDPVVTPPPAPLPTAGEIAAAQLEKTRQSVETWPKMTHELTIYKLEQK